VCLDDVAGFEGKGVSVIITFWEAFTTIRDVVADAVDVYTRTQVPYLVLSEQRRVALNKHIRSLSQDSAVHPHYFRHKTL
jgi:hypothetical protein